jgi:hypothetical protein
MAVKFLGAFAAAAALVLAPAAFAEAPGDDANLVAAVDSQFTVLETNASVSFPSNLTRYQILEDDSLLLTFGANRHYRVRLGSDCSRELRNSGSIVLDAGGAGDFDAMSFVFVRGVSCAVETIDRVERRQGA